MSIDGIIHDTPIPYWSGPCVDTDVILNYGGNGPSLRGKLTPILSHFLVRPRRAAATRTNAAIDASRRGANVNF